MRVPLLVLLLAGGCAASLKAAGPGGNRVVRSSSEQFVQTGSEDAGYNLVRVYGYVVPGEDTAEGSGIGLSGGAKIGPIYGAFGGRGQVPGYAAEPHLDIVWLPETDRWAVTATIALLHQTLYYDNEDVSYEGATPSLTLHWALRRQLYVHGGVGYAFGSVASAADDGTDLPSASVGQARVLGGFTYLLRRTPRLDIALRVEGTAYRTGEVSMGPDTGHFQGLGVTFESIWSMFAF